MKLLLPLTVIATYVTDPLNRVLDKCPKFIASISDAETEVDAIWPSIEKLQLLSTGIAAIPRVLLDLEHVSEGKDRKHEYEKAVDMIMLIHTDLEKFRTSARCRITNMLGGHPVEIERKKKDQPNTFFGFLNQCSNPQKSENVLFQMYAVLSETGELGDPQNKMMDFLVRRLIQLKDPPEEGKPIEGGSMQAHDHHLTLQDFMITDGIKHNIAQAIELGCQCFGQCTIPTNKDRGSLFNPVNEKFGALVKAVSHEGRLERRMGMVDNKKGGKRRGIIEGEFLGRPSHKRKSHNLN